MVDQPSLTPEESLAALDSSAAPLVGFLRRNPITLKELRGRMRGARAFIVLSLYVALMSALSVVLYFIYSVQASVTLTTTGGVIGKLIFGAVVGTELFLVTFIAPAFTSSAISGERERQTFQILRTTLLPAHKIVRGKLIAAMAYILLLLVAAVPLQSLAFLMGGVTIEELFVATELLVVTGFTFALLGILLSAATQRTLSASVITYVIVLLITVALPLALLPFIGVVAAASFSNSTPFQIVITAIFYFLASTNPIATAVMSEVILLEYDTIWLFKVTLANGANLTIPSPWIVYTILYALAALLMLRASVRRVRRIEA